MQSLMEVARKIEQFPTGPFKMNTIDNEVHEGSIQQGQSLATIKTGSIF